MKILVLNGSPSGENSVTLFTVKYLEKHFPQHSFEYTDVAVRVRAAEKDFSPYAAKLAEADLILFSYPVYTFLVPSQLHRFIQLMKEKGPDLRGKWATQITTSKHFYDITAHRFIEDNCSDLGMRVVRGLSADMDDLLTEKGREEALAFFRHLEWSVNEEISEPSHFSELPAFTPNPLLQPDPAPAEKNKSWRVVIVADRGGEDPALDAMIGRFRKLLPCESEIVDLADFTFAGGCLGCFRCAADGACVYKDGFDRYLREHIPSADAIVYAYRIQDHAMGYRMKLFDDRQFCNGHRTVTMGKPVAYLVDGNLAVEPNLCLLMESRAQVGGNHLAGIASNARNTDEEIARVAAELCYAIENRYQQPKNFYGVGGLKIFRDLIYQMRGLMKEDHRFYREHGFYDFPQKKKGRILGMYAVGAMMKSRKLRAKLGTRMTEGMAIPYKKAIEK